MYVVCCCSYVPPPRPWSTDGTRKTSLSPTKPRWDTSPLSKSYTDYSSSIDGQTSRYAKSTPKKDQPLRTAADDSKTEKIRVKSPATIQDSDHVDATVPKTRRTSGHDYSHIKSRISTCWEKDNNGKEVGVGRERGQAVGGSDSSLRHARGKETEGMPTRVKKRIATGGRRPDFSHVTSKVDTKRNGAAAGANGRDGREETDNVSYNTYVQYSHYLVALHIHMCTGLAYQD